MGVFEAVKAIESSQDFAQWRRASPYACLTSCFAMFAEGEERKWLLSYYDSASEQMATFSLEDAKGHQEPFAKGSNIPPLDMKEVSVDDATALEAATNELRHRHLKETAQKTIMVLQKLNNIALWNITFITPTMKVINVKVSASAVEVLDHSISSISDFMQKG